MRAEAGEYCKWLTSPRLNGKDRYSAIDGSNGGNLVFIFMARVHDNFIAIASSEWCG